jgi:hypothetical protein
MNILRKLYFQDIKNWIVDIILLIAFSYYQLQSNECPQEIIQEYYKENDNRNRR